MERHALDVVSLTAGLVFTLTAVVALTDAVNLGVGDLRWIGPGLLVLFGLVLVASSVSKRSQDDDVTTGQAPDAAREDDSDATAVSG